MKHVLCLLMTIPFLLGATIGDHREWLGDALTPFVASGCEPAVPASSLTLAAFACRGYVADTNRWHGFDQSAAAVGPLNGGNATYWLIAHRDTTKVLSGWTRQARTHYLWKLNATLPTIPDGALLLAQITVAGGVITVVDLLRPAAASPAFRFNIEDFGAVANDATDDSAAIQAAVNAACTDFNGTIGGTVYFPNGVYDLTTEVAFACAGVTLKGAGTDRTTITVGANRGFVHEFVSLAESRLQIRDLRILGNTSTSLDLLSIKNAGDVWLENVWIRGTAGDCVEFDTVFGLAISDSRFEECISYAINTVQLVQPVLLINVDFNQNALTSTGHLKIKNSGWWNITSNNFEGTTIVGHAIKLEGATDITIENNFIEFYTSSPIIADTALSQGITIRHNHIHGADSVVIDFNSGGLAHKNIWIEGNRFAANVINGTIFDDGATESYRVCGNTKENAVIAWVQGFNANLDCIEVRAGEGQGSSYLSTAGIEFNDNTSIYRFDGAVSIGGDDNVNLNRSTEELTLASATGTGTIVFRTAGVDRMTVQADGTVAATGDLSAGGDLIATGTLGIGADTNVSLKRATEKLTIDSSTGTGSIALRTAGADRMTVMADGTVSVAGAMAIGADVNVNINRSSEELTLNSATGTGTIAFRTNGADRAIVSSSGGITFQTFTNATLPSAADGTVVYCSDCNPTSGACAASSTGAIAKRLNGAWDCR